MSASFEVCLYQPSAFVSEKDLNEMSRVMRKPAFCICENKGADQLHGNCADDQCLVFAT